MATLAQAFQVSYLTNPSGHARHLIDRLPVLLTQSVPLGSFQWPQQRILLCASPNHLPHSTTQTHTMYTCSGEALPPRSRMHRPHTQ